MDISLFIVNYNAAECIKKCIDSVLMQKGITFEIIVIDNLSVDNSIPLLKEFGEQITIIENKNNVGFGRANNQAFQLSSGKYLFLLNPDAQFLTAHDLQNAMLWMDVHPEYGLAGTKIVDFHHRLTTSVSEHYPKQKKLNIDFSHLPGAIATVLGASMIIKRDIFEKINGFDEDFFLYAEETDLCLRIRKFGYHIGYLPEVTVKHIGGVSEKANSAEEVLLKKKSAKYLFYAKHYEAKHLKRLIKSDLLHARFKLMPLYFLKMIGGLSPLLKQKYNRYQCVFNLAKKHLKN